MESRHTVNCIAVVNIDVSHMYQLVLVDDIDSLIMEIPAYSCVQLPDDRHQLRHYLLQIMNRPFFQRLRQNGMVGISAGLTYHIDSGIHIKAFFCRQDPDQLRNYHCRMSIVDLDAHVLMQVIQVYASFFCFF